MSQKRPADDNSWENDPVWALLDASPPAHAGPRFADDLLRTVRNLPEHPVWWRRLFAPVPLAGLAGACAAVTAAILFSVHPATEDADSTVAWAPPEERFAAIQEIAETEMLLAAVDHLDQFSDQELASLIGF
jgi:hypothetical protein